MTMDIFEIPARVVARQCVNSFEPQRKRSQCFNYKYVIADGRGACVKCPIKTIALVFTLHVRGVTGDGIPIENTAWLVT